MVDQSELPPTRKKDGYCKTCRKKLSNYNLNDYCFLHTLDKLKIEDERLEHKIWMQAIYYRVNKPKKTTKNPVNGKPYRRHSKLTATKVKSIRKSKLTQKELAKKFGVHVYTIKDILFRRTWRDI